jgi:methyltransferase-like protein
MVDIQAIPVPSQDFCVRQVGEETVFLAETGNQIHSLNAIGSYIWQQIDGNHSLQDILEAICQTYDVDAAQAESDLMAFMDELLAKGLLSLQDDDE